MSTNARMKCTADAAFADPPKGFTLKTAWTISRIMRTRGRKCRQQMSWTVEIYMSSEKGAYPKSYYNGTDSNWQ